jgi:hypothetical protein
VWNDCAKRAADVAESSHDAVEERAIGGADTPNQERHRMSTRITLLAVVLAAATLPLQAYAGACVLVAEGADGKPQTSCKYLESEALCQADAAQVATAQWLKAHPPRYVAEKSCNAAVKAAASKAGQQPTPAATKK